MHLKSNLEEVHLAIKKLNFKILNLDSSQLTSLMSLVGVDSKTWFNN